MVLLEEEEQEEAVLEQEEQVRQEYQALVVQKEVCNQTNRCC